MVVLGIIPWDFRFQRPQQISRELSRYSRVFYVSPRKGEHYSVEELSPALFSVAIPSRATPYLEEPNGADKQRWLEAFLVFSESVSLSSDARILIQHPWWWNFAQSLPSRFRIFADVMDRYDLFDNVHPRTRDWSSELVEEADEVFVSSRGLMGLIPNSNLVRNGCDFVFLSRGESSTLMEEDSKPRALVFGYIGAIEDWFDLDAVESLARSFPAAQVVLGGEVRVDVSRLDSLENVTFLGEISHADVPELLRSFDVGYVPFHVNELTGVVDPVKVYEYLAVGIPVVASDLPELTEFGNFAYIYPLSDQIAQATQLALAENSLQKIEERIAFAQENSWTQRASQFHKGMSTERLSASVVVVHYGDIRVLEDLLESFYRDGSNLGSEIKLVVVNNSPELGSRVALLAYQYGFSVVEPGTNLGFAGGVNAGLVGVDTEYVVIANNDVLPDVGAVKSLCRHLQLEPEIGIITPLTDNIGNEANISVTETIGATGRLRSDFGATFGFRNVSNEIRVVPLFFAAMRAALLRELGGVPAEFGRGYFEDDALSAKIAFRALRVVLAEDCFVPHRGGHSFNQISAEERETLFADNRQVYEEKYGTWVPHRYREVRQSPLYLG